MEVEDLLEDDKSEIRIVADVDQIVGYNSNDGSSGELPLVGSEGLLQSENTDVDAEKLNARLEETVPSSAPSLTDDHINQSGGVDLKHQAKAVESQSSASAVCTSWKPNLFNLKEEICLNSLSIRELHETFKATFGRETTVKDKQWLKRRIAMGLTNSCDVSSSSFIIRNNKLVKSGKEESSNSLDATFFDNSVGETNSSGRDSPVSHNSEMEDHQTFSGKRLENPSAEYDCGSDDLLSEQRAAKRVRKPTKRYIEELSEVESKDCCGRLLLSSKSSGHSQTSPKSRDRPVRNTPPDGKSFVTRPDSLGGSGVQVPYVSRVRRSRPRKNIMALMRFHPAGTDMEAKFVENTLGVHNGQPDHGIGDEILKARSASQHVQKPVITARVKGGTCKSELELRVEVNHNIDSSGDVSDDDNIVTVPTAKGGIRRKHHRAWTLGEVLKLVEGVARYGIGRWSEIKRLAFASYSYRTSVDLKDKWRNLLRASFQQSPQDKGQQLKKHGPMPIPAPILLRVRELAELHAQTPQTVGGSARSSSVHETRSDYL